MLDTYYFNTGDEEIDQDNQSADENDISRRQSNVDKINNTKETKTTEEKKITEHTKTTKETKSTEESRSTEDKKKSDADETKKSAVDESIQYWTQMMLTTKSMNWGNKSPFSFALEGTNRKIIAHVSSWGHIQHTWRWGNLKEVGLITILNMKIYNMLIVS